MAPNEGKAGGVYRFKVKLTDPHRTEPIYVRLKLRRDGMWWKAPKMVSNDPSETSVGRIYSCEAQLAAGNWEYSFAAKSPTGLATGPPTMWQVGPTMPAPPYLVWSTGQGFDGLDGVDVFGPDTGIGAAGHAYRVLAQSVHDNDSHTGGRPEDGG